MNQHQFIVEVKWYLQIVRFYIFVGIKKNIVCILVVSELLFLLGDVYCNFDSLLHVSNCPIELECPLRLFRYVIRLTH